MGGNRQPILLGATEALGRRLAGKSDWTVRALAADLKADGIAVSHDTVWRFLRRQGLTFKKTPNGERDGTTEPGAPTHAVENPPTSP
jgi:transposase